MYKQIFKETKIHIYKSIVRSLMTYGVETWTINSKLNSKLKSTEMDFLRSARCSKLDGIRNRIIWEKMNLMKQLCSLWGIRSTVVWTCEEDGWRYTVLPVRSSEWDPNGKNRRGRLKTTWIEGIINLLKDKGLQDGDWKDRDWMEEENQSIILGTGRCCIHLKPVDDDFYFRKIDIFVSKT